MLVKGSNSYHGFDVVANAADNACMQDTDDEDEKSDQDLVVDDENQVPLSDLLLCHYL